MNLFWRKTPQIVPDLPVLNVQLICPACRYELDRRWKDPLYDGRFVHEHTIHVIENVGFCPNNGKRFVVTDDLRVQGI